MTKPMDIEDQDFQKEVLSSDKPVLVDFWAPWCGPCRQIGATINAMIDDHSDVKFVKVNVDNSPQVSTQYGIRSIPTLILFDKGAPQGQLVGAVSGKAIEELIGRSK